MRPLRPIRTRHRLVQLAQRAAHHANRLKRRPPANLFATPTVVLHPLIRRRRRDTVGIVVWKIAEPRIPAPDALFAVRHRCR